ncbi:UNVERIFIED_CONTAM: hypothetical protein FKN15_027921 [Acipenser sinensis]
MSVIFRDGCGSSYLVYGHVISVVPGLCVLLRSAPFFIFYRSHSAIEWLYQLFPEKKRLETCVLRLFDDVGHRTGKGPAMQPTQSYSAGGQRSSGKLTGKPAGARRVYRGRWCAVSRGHPGRPKTSPWAALGYL